jgi:predicted neuraminidase
MVVLSNGDWLFPMYYSLMATGHGDDYTVVRVSADQGENWDEYPVPDSRGRVHASVLELEPGHLVAFMRSRAADRIYFSRSTDYGRVWTVPERTMLPNNNASIQALKLANGNIAIVFNNVSASDDPKGTIWPRQRYPLTVALSQDQGRTWPYMRNIDTGDDFAGQKNEMLNRRYAYPSIIQTRDGLIHIGYSYRGRQCIKYVQITEQWIVDGLDFLYA